MIICNVKLDKSHLCELFVWICIIVDCVFINNTKIDDVIIYNILAIVSFIVFVLYVYFAGIKLIKLFNVCRSFTGITIIGSFITIIVVDIHAISSKGTVNKFQVISFDVMLLLALIFLLAPDFAHNLRYIIELYVSIL